MDKQVNILLITIDTLRADHLGCYGYKRDTSPFIDTLASEGVLCERMFCSGIPTKPSYTTLYTGQHSLTHGIISQNCKTSLARNAPFLPQLFLGADYLTCAVDNLMRQHLWFGRGYEYYIDSSLRHSLPLNVRCEELNSQALLWLRATKNTPSTKNTPFFLFLHYWDPHVPYLPPERYRHLYYNGDRPSDPNKHDLDEWWQTPFGAIAHDTWLRTPNGLITDPEYITALYDQEIRYVDEAVGELLATIDDLGLTDQTLVVVLADHGESMTEHGIFFEHYGLYDTTLHVPFIVRWPGQLPQGVRLPQMLQLTDVAPTLLEAAELPIPNTIEGYSFWKLLTGEKKENKRKAVVSLESTYQASWSLRTDRYKFILYRKPNFFGNSSSELYDLVIDPKEEKNLLKERPDIAAGMEVELEGWIADRLRILGKEKDPLLVDGPVFS